MKPPTLVGLPTTTPSEKDEEQWLSDPSNVDVVMGCYFCR